MMALPSNSFEEIQIDYLSIMLTDALKPSKASGLDYMSLGRL